MARSTGCDPGGARGEKLEERAGAALGELGRRRPGALTRRRRGPAPLLPRQELAVAVGLLDGLNEQDALRGFFTHAGILSRAARAHRPARRLFAARGAGRFCPAC